MKNTRALTPCESAPEKWFSTDPQDVAAAKDGCLDCPLSQYNKCQEQGYREEFGVFGGMSADDRAAARPRAAVLLTERLTARGERTDGMIVRGRVLAAVAGGATPSEAGAPYGVRANTVTQWVKRFGLKVRTV